MADQMLKGWPLTMSHSGSMAVFASAKMPMPAFKGFHAKV
jgi:hypothetical protein